MAQWTRRQLIPMVSIEVFLIIQFDLSLPISIRSNRLFYLLDNISIDHSNGILNIKSSNLSIHYETFCPIQSMIESVSNSSIDPHSRAYIRNGGNL